MSLNGVFHNRFEIIAKTIHDLNFKRIYYAKCVADKPGCYWCVFAMMRPFRCPMCSLSGNTAVGLCVVSFFYWWCTKMVGLGAWRIHTEILGLQNHAEMLECEYADKNIDLFKGIYSFFRF